MPNITFDDAARIMELSLDGLKLHSNLDISRLYDQIEDAISDSGRTHWFFLVEMGDTYVNPAVWSYWASRGRLLNLGHSLGTVRYGASPENRSRLETTAQAEGFNPNICATRAEALELISALRIAAAERTEPPRQLTFHQLFDRVTFDHNLTVVDVDLSHITFSHIGDVQDVFDHLETRILCMSPQLRWYFLVNYDGTQIAPTVVSHFAARGRRTTQRYSKGSARYSVPLSIRDLIYMRAESRNFEPNVFDTRQDALNHLLGSRQAAE